MEQRYGRAMTEVFLSYSRADRPVAEAIARELQQLGVEVWWDHDLLGGDDYRRRISEILARVQAAIVIWSRRSVESQWVTSEAAAARERKVLVPVTIDGENPPIDFRALHTTDLASWMPGDRLPDTLLKALADRVGRELSYADAATARGRGRASGEAGDTGVVSRFREPAVLLHGPGLRLLPGRICRWCSCSGRTGRARSVLPAWSPYLFALMNGIIVAALYMRPALETRRLGIAIPLFVLAAILSVVAYIGGLAVSIAGEREILILVGLATLALLFVTSLAQRASSAAR